MGGAVFLLLGLLLVFTGHAFAQDASTTSDTSSTSSTDQAIADAKKNQEDIAAKQQEIADLNKQIAALRGKQATTANEAALIANQVARIKGQLDKAELELRQTKLNIKAVQGQQQTTQQKISSLEKETKAKKAELKDILKLLYQKEQTSLMTVFLSSGTFSDMMIERENVAKIQDQYINLVTDLRKQTDALLDHKDQLEQQKNDLTELTQMQAAQQADLADQRKQQESFLQAKKKEQLAYEQKIAEAEQARKEIEENVYTLKSSDVKLTFTQAKDMAKYASSLTGVRAALLLAVLKVETNVGANLGSGKFPDDMHPAYNREAFLRITKALGLDPYNTPISKSGAMGPAQVMPQTWEGVSGRVGSLMKKAQPNPYELTDAFVAAALILADKGAADPAKEYEAVNRYMAGTRWQSYTWYGDRVLAVAKEYAQ